MRARICHPVRVLCGVGAQDGMMYGSSKTNGAAFSVVRLNRPVNEHESMNVKYDRGFASVAGQG
jgi:hypothetical protein